MAAAPREGMEAPTTWLVSAGRGEIPIAWGGCHGTTALLAPWSAECATGLVAEFGFEVDGTVAGSAVKCHDHQSAAAASARAAVDENFLEVERFLAVMAAHLFS